MPPMPRAAALIVAAGRGTRMGGALPKQYQGLLGEMVLTRTIRALTAHPAVQEVVIVRHADDSALLAHALAPLDVTVTQAIGGATRDASVKAGLDVVSERADLVLIHDAARPLVSPAVIDGVIAALATHQGAAPGVAVVDALWHGGDTVGSIRPRDGLFRAQTPQGFHVQAIRAAHAAHPGGAADDVEVALAQGLSVAITQGDEDNLKLTRPEDFPRAARILEGRTVIDIRTGNGVDVHRFGPGDHVMLCGVAIPHSRGLQGHSDADVGLHTVTDAIYGALAEGDIGQHFPPSDPQWKGAESHVFLTHAVDLADAHGFTITHADLTLICEQPKIGPHSPAMRTELARLLRIDPTRVSVKATTSERLGFTGREEGIAAMATVTLVKT
ncbi:bifunctional 2-C-methyl-D-erythritol 4-phosphate cytidylyltransferase/2-C-methyl-D-erythritol 2,4-cyclodiphosphate synthase [Nioella nitratireducens]|uniref:bifunctional 2-C-methyl-D-erythritol 4-phosphate cytidylyltransferase/2-C-methyl-D-erythritol 2,4-cyclodiphosphate synthase n=1 Tax=Nioella nitratireducens TaxID=1287720 RepID=UPI000A049188|nr:bifunctional 2-C-methyl-D-erythritol 4-phosphate cytidylyltransferase/2-C-methyl-D-erythritol 2,4-cyclodiphosphate synthase [Nioella nitratireducens]